MTSTLPRETIVRRLWVYQRERFPLLAHLPLLTVVVLATLGYTVAAGGSRLSIVEVAAVATTTLLFFVQLRIADEFKDAATDARYRPNRAVPRGLVTLGELGLVGAAAAGIQVAATARFTPALLPLLAAVWAYMGLMFREFFAADRLRSRPTLYAISHMLVMPLIVAFIAAAAWADTVTVAGIAPLLGTAFFVGLGAETGRKIRAPADERTGVETYSAIFGRARAIRSWLVSLTLATAAALGAAFISGRSDLTFVAGGALLLVALAVAARFTRHPTRRSASAVEYVSGAAVLVLHGVIGLGPILTSSGPT